VGFPIEWQLSEGIAQLTQRKGKKMSSKITSSDDENNENEKEKEMNFEFIDESEIESVKRGRKSFVMPELVNFLIKAKVGQTVKVPTFAIESTIVDALDRKNAKAKASAILRTQAKNAGWKKVGIIWDVNAVPFVKRLG
jgi:hypothetical protein